ncbi:WD40-repeat-containing domain protein [Syncephalis plumigaleata]|nr:WD40-repeat-containing domain protein [Syncephalis plumigaleata]
MSDQLYNTQPRFAHSEGHTIVTHSLLGRHVFTAGEDMLIRMFATAIEERDNEARTLENHTSSITCMATTKELLIVGSEDRSVVCFHYPSLEFSKLLVRCDLIAIATEDPSISIKHINESKEMIKLRGHTKPIHCVKFAPTTNDLLSVDASGEVRLWKEENGTFTCTKKWASLVHEGVFSNKGGNQSVSWAPNGIEFAASGASGIMLVNLETGMQTLRTNAYLDKVTNAGIVWSTWGHIAIYNMDRKLLVLQNHTDNASECYKYDHSADIIHASWHPQRGSLALTDRRGQLIYYYDIINITDNQVVNTSELLADIPMTEDDNDWMETEQTEGRNGTITSTTSTTSTDPNHLVESTKQNIPKLPVPSMSSLLSNTRGDHSSKGMKAWSMNALSSWINNRRYFDYNAVGHIIGVQQDNHVVIRVEFNDKSTFRGFHFTDYRNFTRGILGEQACLFANHTDDNEVVSVYYRPFDHLTHNEWTKTLPEGVNVQAMASTEYHIILCLSNDWIHVLTRTGIERELFVLPNVVACTAHDDYALLILTSGSPLDTKLRYIILRLSDSQFIQQGDLPLTGDRALKWTGFSDIGAPAMMDTMDTAYLLVQHTHPGQARWTPVFQRVDTRNNQFYYFPIGITDQQLSCVLCPRDRPMPSFGRPMIHEFELKLPLLHGEASAEQAQEEKLLRLHTLLAVGDHESNPARKKRLQAESDKTVLTMIQMACKHERLQQALELCSMLYLPAAYDAACTIANYHRMPSLAERMLLLKETVQEKELAFSSSSSSNLSNDTLMTTQIQTTSATTTSGISSNLINLIKQGNNNTVTGSIGKRTSIADPLMARKKQVTLNEQNKVA